MAKPVPFEQANAMLGPPPGISDEDCGTAPAYVEKDKGVFVTCWELTEQEQVQFMNNGGKVFLWVYGAAHPMVYISPAFVELEAPKPRAEG